MGTKMKKAREVPPPPVAPKIEIVEEEGGLMADLGQYVLIICASYFYYGQLTGVNCTCVELTDAKIVYQTGDWSKSSWADAQKLPGDKWTVHMSQIESHGRVKKS